MSSDKLIKEHTTAMWAWFWMGASLWSALWFLEASRETLNIVAIGTVCAAGTALLQSWFEGQRALLLELAQEVSKTGSRIDHIETVLAGQSGTLGRIEREAVSTSDTLKDTRDRLQGIHDILVHRSRQHSIN